MSDDLQAGARPKPLVALAVALWAATSVLSVVLIPALIDLVTEIYAAFWAGYTVEGRTYWGGVAIRQVLVLPLAIVAVGVIIGGAEYHLRHFNEPGSWRIFTHTLAAEIAVLLMAWLL